MSFMTFFRDPFHRGMSLLFIAHVLALALLVDLASRTPAKPLPDCAVAIVVVGGLTLALVAILNM